MLLTSFVKKSELAPELFTRKHVFIAHQNLEYED